LSSLIKTNASDHSYEEQVKTLLTKLNLNNNKMNQDLLLDVIEQDVDFPKVSEFLPHLIGKTHAIQPKFKISKNRFASIVIGIPTTKREKTSYLLETLKSVLDAMNELEKSEALIVVMIAEVMISVQFYGCFELLKIIKF